MGICYLNFFFMNTYIINTTLKVHGKYSPTVVCDPLNHFFVIFFSVFLGVYSVMSMSPRHKKCLMKESNRSNAVKVYILNSYLVNMSCLLCNNVKVYKEAQIMFLSENYFPAPFILNYNL